MTLFVASVAFALLISATCSVMEATLLSLTPSHVADLPNRQPRVGEIWQRFKSNVQPPIAAILLLNTAAHTIGASVAGSQFDKLVGELEGKFDRLPKMTHALAGGTWMIGGGVPMADVATLLDQGFEESKETLAAWLLRKLGRVPRTGESVREGQIEFIVRRTRRGQVFEVAAHKRAIE